MRRRESHLPICNRRSLGVHVAAAPLSTPRRRSLSRDKPATVSASHHCSTSGVTRLWQRGRARCVCCLDCRPYVFLFGHRQLPSSSLRLGSSMSRDDAPYSTENTRVIGPRPGQFWGCRCRVAVCCIRGAAGACPSGGQAGQRAAKKPQARAGRYGRAAPGASPPRRLCRG